jgi:hypothetical protein
MTAKEIYCAFLHGPFTADGEVDTEGWTREERRKLLAFQTRRHEQMNRDERDRDQLNSLLDPVYGLYPEIAIYEAIEKLCLPDMANALSLLKSLDRERPLILECRKEHRKEWHHQADAALTVALRDPEMICPRTLALRAGMPLEHLEEASRYIVSVLRESCAWRIEEADGRTQAGHVRGLHGN